MSLTRTSPASGSAVGKRTIKQIFEESLQLERKLSFHGPDNLRPDSRYAIAEINEDHAVFRLIGDDNLVLPYASITSLRVGATQLTIRYR